MNTPDSDLLQPLSETPELEAELVRAADLIARLRNYGTTQLRAVMESRQGQITADEAIPLIVALGQLRWGLELLSGIERQIRDGWTGPAKVTIRSLFECMLAAKYALSDPAERARRARACLFVELMKSRAFLLSRLPGTDERKRIEALAERDQFGGALLATLPEDRVRADLKRVEHDMAASGMAEVAAEADRLKKLKNNNPDAFEFFDGPRSLQQLADRTGYPLSYEVLYRLWSQSAHATVVVRPAVRVSGGQIEMLGLRHPSDLDEVKVTAFTFGAELFRSVAVVLPGDFGAEFANWYVSQRADLLRRVSIVDSKDG
ncbi:MAG: DUF5677 domain-containing protein [Planctomycetota bacterium]